MKTSPDYISYQGYATLYGFEDDGSRHNAVELLRDAGMSLAIPGSPGKVLVLDDTLEKRRDVTDAEFQKMVRSAPSLWFKAWNPEGSDLLCNVQRKGGWWCQYYVIGYLQADAEPLVEKLVQWFIAESSLNREHLLVVDWQNRTEGVDWDEIWEKTATYDGEAPEVIGIPERLVSQFVNPLDGQVEDDLPGHRLLTRSTVFPSRDGAEG